MRPVSPVLPGVAEVVYAKDQPEYLPLPAIKSAGPQGMVTTRWYMGWKERLRVLFTGSVYLQVMTYKHKLQPVKVFTKKPLIKDVL